MRLTDIIIEFDRSGTTLQATLNDTNTAKLLSEILPINATVNLWGDEIYFGIDLITDNESPQETVELGDLAYWPPGNAFCVFFGDTPASTGGEIKPASAVTVIGKLKSDPIILKDIKSLDNITIRSKS